MVPAPSIIRDGEICFVAAPLAYHSHGRFNPTDITKHWIQCLQHNWDLAIRDTLQQNDWNNALRDKPTKSKEETQWFDGNLETK